MTSRPSSSIHLLTLPQMRTYLIYSLLLVLAGCLYWLYQTRLKSRSLCWIGFGLLAVALLALLGLTTEPQVRELFVDFTTAYYPAATAALHNPAALYAKTDNDLTFVNLPIVSLLFVPFAVFPVSTAALVMTLLGVVVTIAACYACIRYTQVTGWRKLALIGLFIANGPLFYNLRIGNTSQYVLLLLLGALFCLRAQRSLWAGGLLAIAAIIKVPLLLLGAYYLLRGRWHVVIGFAGTLVAVVLLSVLVFGPGLHATWYQECIQPFAGKPISAFNVQSVDGFLSRSLLGGGLRNWLPMSVGWDYKLIRYALLSLLVGSALWVGWRAQPPATEAAEHSEFAIALCLALIISPISWTHYYMLLLLPLALYVGQQLALPNQATWFRWMALSGLLLSLPTVNLSSDNPVLKLVMSHYFFGGTLLLGVLLVGRWQTAMHPRFSDPDARLLA